MKTMYGRNIRIYFFSMVLSYSRMKFAYFSAEPFDAKKTIEGHVYAFRYFGGRPQMIVYDQDKTMVVSENLGDVIFVKEFEDFIRETGFSIYLCRGYDPSTKGKVEKTVDFVKHQFLDGRIYYGIDRLNCEFMDWLDREGNGLINDITKKVPRDMFKKEYPKLIKYYEKRNDESVVHTVYHDTIEYRENLYKLPLGNINDGDRIRIERYDDQLLFYHATTNELVCKHKLVSGKGNIVTLPKAEKEELSIEELLHKDFAEYDDAIKFLKRMREQKSRYVYPQCRKLERMRRYYKDKKIVEGMRYCLSVDTCTVFELSSWLVMDMGIEIAKPYLNQHTIRHYKDRASEIEKELKENGRG